MPLSANKAEAKALMQVETRQGNMPDGPARLHRLVSQFAILSVAEVICRLISLAVVVELARRVGREGYGRIEFAFSIVFWLIFVLRDGVELVFCREVARRPRPKPSLVNAFIALKILLALILWLILIVASLLLFKATQDRLMLASYGALLLSTALGLDNVFRGRERPGIVAVSLVTRTVLYASAVLYWVHDGTRLLWVPWLLFGGELLGIMLVWARYSMEFGAPRPRWRHGRRFGAAVLAQGRSVLGIQLAQVILSSLDVVIVGLSDSWSMVGLYGAPHRIVTAAVTFGLIFQQVLLPHLVRSMPTMGDTQGAKVARIVRLALAVMVPCALMVSLASRLVIDTLFTTEFDAAWPLLAIGIWRVPILAVCSIHITTLVASHREREGLRIMVRCLLFSVPLVIFMHFWRGLIGTSSAMVLVAINLAVWTGRAVYLGDPRVMDQKTDNNLSIKSAGLMACVVVVVFILLQTSDWPLTQASEDEHVQKRQDWEKEAETGENRLQQASKVPETRGLAR